MTQIRYAFPMAVAALAALLATSPAALAGPEPEKAEKVTYLGVAVAAVDDTLRDQLKLSRGVGLSVQQVVPDSPAGKAGVKTHDILEKVNDQLLFNPPQLASLVRSFAPGDKVTLALLREGNRQTLEVALGETEVSEASKSLFSVWESGAGTPQVQMMFDSQFEKALKSVQTAKGGSKPVGYLGLELAPVEAALATQLGLEGEAGALVKLVVEDSPAAKAGLKPHDVVTKLEGKPVKDPADLSARIREHKNGDKVTLNLLRAGKPVELEATLGEKTPPDLGRLPKLIQDYRVIPHIQVLPGTSSAGDVVVHLDSEGGADSGRTERRVIVRAIEAGKPGEMHFESAPVKTTTRTSVEHKVIVIKTDEGLTTTVSDENGKRHITVKDAQDKVIFDGPVNSPEERQKLPPEVREQLDKIETKVEVDVDTDGKGAIRELRVAPQTQAPEVI